MLTQAQLVVLGQILGSLLLGVLALYFLLKYKVEVVREKGDFLILRIPFLGNIRTNFRIRYSGIFVEEWEELKSKIEALGRFLDPKTVFRYTTEYGVNYVGLEGDKGDESWTKGKLACLTHGDDYKWGYNIFLNPQLDLREVSRRLSQELGAEIQPSEVHTFLFFHEIGHTTEAGNQCYWTAAVNHALSGGKRSAKRRRELRFQKSEMEKFADQFALRELKKLRASQGSQRDVHK